MKSASLGPTNGRLPNLIAKITIAFALAAQLVLVAGVPAAEAATVTLSGSESYPDGFTVPAGQVWEFDPNADTTVTVSGNVVVLGTLRMRPSSAGIEHVLKFEGIDESKFVGGGHTPADAPDDIGVWVNGAGHLDISGTPVTPWARSWQSDWSAADDIVAAPNTPGNYSTFTQVNGSGDVPGPNAYGHQTELLNLTRNVRIEGTPTGRTHIMIHAPDATEPQIIEYAAIRYVAPWVSNGGEDDGTDHRSGRYGLHFHHNGNSTVGSIVEGVVVRDAGNHAFVPHASHGITLRETIAYNVTSEAYWWDESNDAACAPLPDTCNASDNIIYDSVVAAKVEPNPSRKHEAAAIQLGAGEDNVIVNSVVVAAQNSGENNSGYHWPGNDRGIWGFANNVAHNNETNGIFVWQNTTGDPDRNHVIDGFTAYYNGKAGIDHGAYNNSYVYLNLTLQGNEVAIDSQALGKAASDGSTDTQVWSNVVTSGGVLRPKEHNNGTIPVRFLYCEFGEVVFNEGVDFGLYDFVECDLSESDFDLSDAANGTTVRVQDGNTAFQIVANGNGGGTFTSISPFLGSVPQPPPPPDPGGVLEGSTFLDVSGSIFKADIEWLAAQGITKGCNPPTNNLFCPDSFVTRGQMAAFLNRALALPAGTGNPFTDDNGSIFEADIEAIEAAGITLGCNPPANTKYCPDGLVTRAQMAAFLVRALDLPPGPEKFGDDNGSIFEADIEALAAAGITLGCNPPANNLFCPDNFVTRAQMAAFLHRAEPHL